VSRPPAAVHRVFVLLRDAEGRHARWALAWLELTSDGDGRRPAVAVALLGQAGERGHRRRIGSASVMGAWPPPGALDPASARGRREQPPCRGKAMVFGLRASSREAAGAGAPQGCKPCGAAAWPPPGKRGAASTELTTTSSACEEFARVERWRRGAWPGRQDRAVVEPGRAQASG
jgi:hypothetical protein